MPGPRALQSLAGLFILRPTVSEGAAAAFVGSTIRRVVPVCPPSGLWAEASWTPAAPVAGVPAAGRVTLGVWGGS